MASFFVSDFFPSLSWIDKLTGVTARLEKIFNDLDEFYKELIEQHLNPNRPKSMEGDILDILLQLKKEKSTPIDLTLEDIKALVMVISYVLNLPIYIRIYCEDSLKLTGHADVSTFTLIRCNDC